jgi:coenzyme F420-reducing hydrogenase delta subunit
VGCPSRAIELSRFADTEILTRVESALAARPQDGAPRIIGFRCNWCSYTDADLPFDRLQYSSDHTEVIRVPCVGRIDPLHVLWAFVNGADGVFLGGCPPEDCRYKEGSSQAEQRISKLNTLLDACGFDSRRLAMEWIRRDNPEALAEKIRSFARGIEQLGRRGDPLGLPDTEVNDA